LTKVRDQIEAAGGEITAFDEEDTFLRAKVSSALYAVLMGEGHMITSYPYPNRRYRSFD
jgi:hypothetical protein